MPTVAAISIAPVKSLGLVHPQTVHVGPQGIREDRRLHLINHQGKLLTQREMGKLVQVKADYQVEPERLRLTFPDGSNMEGPLGLGSEVVTEIWGRGVPGHLVAGGWSQALSDFCQQPVLLVQSNKPCQCYDEYPVSLLSQASVEELGHHARLGEMPFDSRRFRPNFLLKGCEAHEEDGWLGGVIQIGDVVRLRVVARDPRCAITTHDPETGERDFDTLRLILSYRPSPRAAYFGVYGMVERPGEVSLGDVLIKASL